MNDPIKRLLEAPELTVDDDFGLTADAGQQDMLAHIDRMSGKASTVDVNGTVLTRAESIQSPGTFYIYLVLGGKIEYYAMVGTTAVPPLKGTFSYQQAVWRGPGCPKGLPSAVFWQEVFAGDKVVSDQSQTQGGRVFWRDRVSEAFKRGLTVAAVDTDRKHLFPFADYDAFQQFAAVLYGDKNYRKYRIVISAGPLIKSP